MFCSFTNYVNLQTALQLQAIGKLRINYTSKDEKVKTIFAHHSLWMYHCVTGDCSITLIYICNQMFIVYWKWWNATAAWTNKPLQILGHNVNTLISDRENILIHNGKYSEKCTYICFKNSQNRPRRCVCVCHSFTPLNWTISWCHFLVMN